ncbi:hypothetical protein C8Q77DRAFT_1165618 [Trametes polyzona]|nr:hypothetical protein C8Q77DRAFT_1165618 [Trametes polyzona]
MLKRPKDGLDQVLESAAGKLASGNPTAAAAVVHKALDGSNLDNPSRFHLYERSIASFLRYQDVMKAAMLYSRMTREGYIPSVSLRVRMHLVKLAELAVEEEVLLDTMRKAFTQESFDEIAFRELLRMLVEGLRSSPPFIRQVVDMFIKCRDPGYTLSTDTTTYLLRAFRSGNDDAGANWWSPHASSSPSAEAQTSAVPLSPSSPYATLLQDLAASKPSFEVYKWTLERLQADNVEPDLPFFNALLAYEVGRRNYEVVFAIYTMLMERRTAAVKPTCHTFSIVFRALHRLAGSHRYRRINHVRVPPNVPSARAVFKDMLTCHLEDTTRTNQPHSSLDAQDLHKALRVFMVQRDYAAAFAAIRAFRLFPGAVGRPTMATYRLVLGGILWRVRTQHPLIATRTVARLSSSDIWAYRFLGMDELPQHLISTLPLGLDLVHQVLLIGAEPRLSLDWIHSPNYTKPRSEFDIPGLDDEDAEDEHERIERISDPAEFHPYGMPTPIELAGLKPVPDDQTYGLVPLERVLRRAIAASVPPGEGALSARVSETIREAKKEMIVRR